LSLTSLETTQRTVDAYARTQASILATLLRILFLHWGRLPDRKDRDMVRAWVARSAVDVDIALETSRRLARTYALTRLAQLDAVPDRMPDFEDAYARSGVPIVEVYARPVREANFVERRELADGVDPEVAAAKAEAAFRERMEAVAQADMAAIARDETAAVFAASPKVIGYRRIIHPELSTKTGVCGLCIVAADRLYSTDDLMELHGGCNCTTDAVTAESDPGLSLNRADLDRLYAAAGSMYSDDLKEIRLQSYQHGELGPILIKQGDKFRTVEDVNRARKVRRDGSSKSTPYSKPTAAENQTNWRAIATTSERSIRFLQNARSRGTDMVDLGTGRPTRVKDIDAAIQYHRDLIARARRHAA
jgi:hypothetical protein